MLVKNREGRYCATGIFICEYGNIDNTLDSPSIKCNNQVKCKNGSAWIMLDVNGNGDITKEYMLSMCRKVNKK